jgi:hypothetical protein
MVVGAASRYASRSAIANAGQNVGPGNRTAGQPNTPAHFSVFLKTETTVGVPNFGPYFWLKNGTDSWDRAKRPLLPDTCVGVLPGQGTPRDAPGLRVLPDARARRSTDRRRPRLSDKTLSLECFCGRPHSATPL